MTFTLVINGEARRVEADPETPLLWVLRDTLDLVGTKFGCGGGFCGACTVHVDGRARRSCQLPVGEIGAARIVTIEGLSSDNSHPVQRAWRELDVPQCGYCQAGQIMTAAALLARTPGASDEEIAAEDPSPYDPSRMARVIEAAAERGGFGTRAPEGRARGFAAHYTFGSYCAQVVELSIDDRTRVNIHRVVAVADAGQPVNLSGFEAQVEGGIIDGIGAAFFGNVAIARGGAIPANFDSYRLIRNREAPADIEVVILPSRARPTGMGEIAIPPIAPAGANAMAALTGSRIRHTPFAREGYDLAPATQ
jgi:isoquinoline 1-oxidoreductase alpha subunit